MRWPCDVVLCVRDTIGSVNWHIDTKARGQRGRVNKRKEKRREEGESDQSPNRAASDFRHEVGHQG